MNRVSRIILLTALLALACQVALADIGPPVTIKLSSELKPAVAGELYRGTLTITAHAPVAMDNFRIEGKSWSSRQVQQLEIQDSTKSASHEVPFSAVPADPDQPLVILFDVNGQTVRKTLDLSARNIERAFTPAPTRTAPPMLPNTYPSSSHEGLEPDTSAAPEKDSAGQIRVTGRFSYLRIDGVRDMARSMLVEIYDEDWDMDADDLLGSGYTDEFGFYDFYVDDANDDPNDVSDIKAVFKTRNIKVDLRNPTTDQTFAYSSTVNWDFTGTVLDFGHLEPDDESERPGLFLFNTASRAYLWCILESGYEMPPVKVYWPDGDSGAWYIPNSDEIHISTAREWNDGTVGHEYGHYWEDTFSIKESRTYCNPGGWCDTPEQCGHCFWCEESEVVAWLEGWAQFFSYAFTQKCGALFGIVPLAPRAMETLLECGTWGYHDPDLVEGFCGAMLQDIYDDNFDNDPLYPDWSDAAFLGIDEIMTVVELDNPSSPMTFLDSFIARYPLYKEGIWETGANNGYDADHYYPAVAGGLTSPSHSKTGDSADPTIDFTWVTANDDASGIAGYGLSISFSAEMPAEVMDIGDVTAYTTDPLSPGTYWFNIRSVDRAGNWGQDFVTYGPVTIQAAEEVDLAWYDPTSWPYTLVPSDVTTNTSSSCPMPATLPGNSTATYWNVMGINNGTVSASSFHVGLNVDGQSKAGLTFALANPGGGYYATNRGPLFFDGGRHTIGAFHDDTNVYSEPEETNNFWAHQFIWTTNTMTLNENYGLEPPSPSTGGWDDIVDGQTKYYNCFGQAFSSTGYWHAVTLKALEPADNYELRLHNASTGAENGYGANLAYSARGAGFLDAVLINSNTTGFLDYNVGVVNHYGSSDIYTTQLVRETFHTFGDSLNYTLNAYDQLRMFEFYVAVEDAGWVSIIVDADPAAGPLRVLWLDESFTYGTLYSYDAYAVQDEFGRARMDLHIPDTGYNCVVVYREPADGNTAQDFTLEIQATPPDMRVVYAPGWYAPVVPRPAPDGIDELVAEPDTLFGAHAGATYLNIAYMNDSPNDAGPYRVDIDLDGELLIRYYNSFYTAGNVSLLNSATGTYPRGGRHTLDVECDPDQTMEEISETNNTFGRQFVWGPLTMTAGTTQARLSPPAPYGGWAKVDTGLLYFNCDGLRTTSTHYWHAMAVMPVNAGDRLGLRMHLPVAGTSGGFGPNVAYSNWAAGESDFVLVNFNQVTAVDMDVGVLDFDDGGDYRAHSVGSPWLAIDPRGTYGPYTLASGEILYLHELSFTEPGTHSFRLESTSGAVDWGMSLFGEDVTYTTKSGSLPGGSSWLAGAGVGEEFAVHVADTGYYCLAVWKVGSADLNEAGTYTLTVFPGVSAVGDDIAVPSLTRLTSVQPNPFNPATNISFDLERSETVILEVYDLQGRLVRTLLNESRPAGTHRVRWDGLDDGGRQVASNVYLARFRAGSINQSTKLVLLK